MTDPALSADLARRPNGTEAAKAFESAVWLKVGIRLLPFLFVLYLVNILDRINVGFAKLTMLEDLHLDETQYGFLAGLFYIGYILFEVPSNLILDRTGARVWIARIMITWGLVSGAMMFVTGWWSFAALRLLLGVAEAGFFPGIILYLTYWFPARTRGRVVALFMIASPTAGMIGNPISGSIMQFMDGAGGLTGWQWLFLIEALPSVVLGVGAWWFLTDRPEQARWLTATERDWLVARMSHEEKRRPQRHFMQALAQPAVWVLCGVYFSAAVSTNGVGFFLPSYLQSLFPTFNKFELGWLAAIPSLAGIVGMVSIGLLSDRTGDRRGFVAMSALMGASGLVLSVVESDPWLSLTAMAFAYFGMFAMLPTFWALATHNLTGTAAAGSIALINSLANIGGFLSPFLVGAIRDRTHSFVGGWWLLAGCLVLGSILVFCVRHDRSLEHK